MLNFSQRVSHVHDLSRILRVPFNVSNFLDGLEGFEHQVEQFLITPHNVLQVRTSKRQCMTGYIGGVIILTTIAFSKDQCLFQLFNDDYFINLETNYYFINLF